MTDSGTHDRTQQPDQRETGFAASDEHRRRSYELEDRRWRFRLQLRDWLVLGGMMTLSIAWALLAFVFEPGLR